MGLEGVPFLIVLGDSKSEALCAGGSWGLAIDSAVASLIACDDVDDASGGPPSPVLSKDTEL